MRRLHLLVAVFSRCACSVYNGEWVSQPDMDVERYGTAVAVVGRPEISTSNRCRDNLPLVRCLRGQESTQASSCENHPRRKTATTVSPYAPPNVELLGFLEVSANRSRERQTSASKKRQPCQ